MATSECFDGTQIRVMDVSKEGHLRWTSTLQGISLNTPPNVCKRLVIVQAINNAIRDKLQEDLLVDKEFFENHLDNRWWYLSNGQPGRSRESLVPELPSQTSKLNYIKLRFIQAGDFPLRTLQDRVNIAHADTEELCVRSCLGRRTPHSLNQRQALVVQQTIPGQGDYLKYDKNLPVMFAHTCVSAWFKMQDDGRWTGVILFDPPFAPKAQSGSVSREFEEKTPTLCEKYFFSLTKNCGAFTSHPFLVLSSVYGSIAEEWLETSRYIKRELQAIEFNLEMAHHNVSQCEEYLVHLAAYRRRISCYIELTHQQLAAIESFGCKAWIVKKPSKDMIQARKELREDFVYVVKVLEKHSQRLNHNLELLLGLRAVALNRIMASFALIGVFFLPFNVVAAILGMPGEYGPGTKNFWVYWAILAPVMAVVLLVHQAYGIARQPRVCVRRTYGISRRMDVDRHVSRVWERLGSVWRGIAREDRPYSQTTVAV